MQRSKYTIVYAGVCFCLLIICACFKTERISDKYEFYTVDKINIKDVVTQIGTVEPARKIEIKSETSGKVDRIYVREGQRVNRGDTILIIEPSLLKMRKRQLSLEAKATEIEFELAQRENENIKKLKESNSVSGMDIYVSDRKAQLAELKNLRKLQEIQEIQWQIDRTVITSPASGILTILSIDEGEVAVSALSGMSTGTDIAVIADVSKVEIVSSIGELDYHNMNIGDSVSVYTERQNQSIPGIISFLSLSARNSSLSEVGFFEVRISVDSVYQNILPGTKVHVEFVIAKKDNVTGIPLRYIISENKNKYVLISRSAERNNKVTYEKVMVTAGINDYRNCEITEGLSVNDVIVRILGNTNE